MKVLLTGASGFVGSHILDALVTRGLSTAVLLRPTSSKQFLEPHLGKIELRLGGLEEPASLGPALDGVTHVLHCAGATKALRSADFFQINQIGTRHLVQAVNRQGSVQRLLLVSSLAASGPASPDQPARETDPPHPVSPYGQSKLAAEQEVLQHCQTDHVIVRPPAVYGPRDTQFLPLFKAVQAHLLPRYRGGTQALSLVFAPDLARCIVECLLQPAARGKTYFVASPEVVTATQMAQEIATQLGTWTIPVPLPALALWLACAGAHLLAQLRRRPSLLSLSRYHELRAPGWVCSPERLRTDLGLECRTPLQTGIGQTLAWYKQHRWL
jgi:nucleoside-diphosphate-sugar epimerase